MGLGREIPQLMGALPGIAQLTISRLIPLIYPVGPSYIGWDRMLAPLAMSYYITMVSDLLQFKRHKIADVNRGRMGQADYYPTNGLCLKLPGEIFWVHSYSCCLPSVW